MFNAIEEAVLASGSMRAGAAVLVAAAMVSVGTSGCLVSEEGFIPPKTEPELVHLIIQLLEWRLGAAGPGISGRQAVRYESAYADPAELLTSDDDGVIDVMAPGPVVHLAVEAPHGQRFYVLPNMQAGELHILHPDFPDPATTVPLTIVLDPGSTPVDTGTLQAGGPGTEQQVVFTGPTTSYDLDLQQRNFHADGTVTLGAALTQSGNPLFRAALQQLPASDTVTLDVDFAPFTVNVDPQNAMVSVAAATLVGHVAGASVRLSTGSDPFEVQLPLVGTALGLDQFDYYTLEVGGTAADSGGIVNTFFAGKLFDPTQISDAVDPTTGSVNLTFPLLGPITVNASGSSHVVRAVSASASTTGYGGPDAVATSNATGGDTPVVRVVDETSLRIDGGDGATEELWSSLLTNPGTGTIVVDPEVRITDVDVSGSVSAKSVDAQFTVRPKDCNALEIVQDLPTVSDWVLMYVENDDGTGCYTYFDTSNAGRGGTDDTVTVQFSAEDGAIVASTSSTVAPGAEWISPTFGMGIPQSGDPHDGSITAVSVDGEASWQEVLANAVHEADGGVVIQPGDSPIASFPVQVQDQTPFSFTWGD